MFGQKPEGELAECTQGLGIVSMRLGVDVWKRVEADSSAFFALQEFNDNDTSMVFICRYLTVLNEVMEESHGGKRATLRPSAATATG